VKVLVFFLLLYSSLFSKSIYTLDNVEKLGIYMDLHADFIGKDEKIQLKKFVKDKLLKAGFVFGKVDSAFIIVRLNAKEIDDTYIINIDLGLAEDVATFRKDNTETFAYTYLAGSMIESDEPMEDTKEYIAFLLYEFIAAHKEDNEE